MSKKDIEKLHHTTFEDLRQFDSGGNPFWTARMLARVLEYSEYRQFDSGGNPFWTARMLARVLEYSEYRHFLPVIEKAKEACRNSGQLVENHFEDFLGLVKSTLDFAIFQNHGYKGLYGGLDAQAIHNRKVLKKGQKILDHMGSTELAANLFRATQTEEKLRRENIQGKNKANTTHFEVGNKVRQTIKELGGTMPEDLPTPKKSIAQVKRKKREKIKNE